MGMAIAVKSVLSNYVNFSGRAARPEYWWWALAVFIIMLIAGFLDAFVIAPLLGFDVTNDTATGTPLSLIISLGILLPNLAVAVRRLHDIDKSGWWILIFFIPIIGFLLLLFWYVSKGTEGENRFGSPVSS
ncbi:MAG: DUF805 domain-containing protein [Sneathiella sp.]|uniref:DUF805 domain-containing protein n=1 Tax=Sneathiella sp. TaxID=1964365 RepID=UPI0030013135